MRYQGGKNGAGVFQTIINRIPWHWRYVEAFAGSAAIYRHKLPARGGNILIERDPDQVRRLRADPATSNATVLDGDAFALLPTLKLGVQDFVYLDPPYHPERARAGQWNLYAFEPSADDHRHLIGELLPALSAQGCQWALSGYRTADYDDAAAVHGWHRTDYLTPTRRRVVTESLWTNFDPAMIDRLHDHRHLGEDFRERERIARKVRRWADKLQRLPPLERAAIMEALSTTANNGERIPRGV